MTVGSIFAELSECAYFLGYFEYNCIGCFVDVLDGKGIIMERMRYKQEYYSGHYRLHYILSANAVGGLLIQ